MKPLRNPNLNPCAEEIKSMMTIKIKKTKKRIPPKQFAVCTLTGAD
jgi:hypothetical protein